MDRCLKPKEHELLVEAIACKRKYHSVTPRNEEKLREIEKWLDSIKCA